MNEKSDNPAHAYDVAIVGAGPSGCEAAMSAAAAGARVICLTINLDTVALHPANPVLAAGLDDPRLALIEELRDFGGALPALLDEPGVLRERGSRIVIDRRRLGLAYKERLESTSGVVPRQTLVNSVQADGAGWTLTTALDEKLSAASVVIATGTYLDGEVDEGGLIIPGGRHGDVAADSLARCLERMELIMERTTATCFPRLAAGSAAGLPPDESALGEAYGMDIDLEGNRALALRRLRQLPGRGGAWITRSQFTVRHLMLAAGQVTPDLEVRGWPGLFFSGRVAGSCNYAEAAVLGLVAGKSAAARAAGGGNNLIKNPRFVDKLCDAIAHQQIRPVTVRVPPPGC